MQMGQCQEKQNQYNIMQILSLSHFGILIILIAYTTER